MKTLPASAVLLLFLGVIAAQSPAADSPEVGPRQKALLNGWGMIEDPDGDCHFTTKGKTLTIQVPGENGAHDLAAEIGLINAPRVVQPVRGDFTCEVIVDGDFAPGGDSTQPGRTGYKGAGIILMADPTLHEENVGCN